MDNLDSFIVPTTDTLEVKTNAKTGGGLPPRKTMLIAGGIVVVLVIVVIVLVWRKRYHSKPNCSGYKGLAGTMCQDVVAACRGDGACLNAAAHCLPIAARLGSAGSDLQSRADALGSFSERTLSACASSIARVDPKLIGSMPGACLPAQVAGGVAALDEKQMAASYNKIASAVNAARPLAPWAVRVAKSLPTCPTPPSTPPPAPPAAPAAPAPAAPTGVTVI